MTLATGFRTSADNNSGQIATIFTAPGNLTINLFRTRVTSTGNAANISVEFSGGATLRTVNFSNTDSNLVQTNHPGTMSAGQSLYFESDNTSRDYNASANFELDYTLEVVIDPNEQAAQDIINDLSNWNYPPFFDNNVTFFQAGQISATTLVNAWNDLIDQGLITPKAAVIPNIRFTYTFPDGHTDSGITTEFDFGILLTAPRHTATLTSSETFDPVNSEAISTLLRIEAHKIGDIPPPTTTNRAKYQRIS